MSTAEAPLKSSSEKKRAFRRRCLDFLLMTGALRAHTRPLLPPPPEPSPSSPRTGPFVVPPRPVLRWLLIAHTVPPEHRRVASPLLPQETRRGERGTGPHNDRRVGLPLH